MNDPEKFLARWSRRKREAEETRSAPEAPDAQRVALSETDKPEAKSDDARENEAPFDPASLPPLESLGPGSDIRAFLARNVPADIARAALRRAWISDPAIRDFVGLAENAWDFNAPDTIPGFGPLEMTDELRRQVAEVVGEKIEAAKMLDADTSAPRVESVPMTSLPPDTESDTANRTETAAPDSAPSVPSHNDASTKRDAAEQRIDTATQHDRPPEPAPARGQGRLHGRALPQ